MKESNEKLIIFIASIVSMYFGKTTGNIIGTRKYPINVRIILEIINNFFIFSILSPADCCGNMYL